MKRIAFKMKLNKGSEVEYRRRHAEIWPDLKELLTKAGISNYSIFLDKETSVLFAYMESHSSENLSNLAGNRIMQKWWAYMCDIMDTHADNSPVSADLEEVFHLR